MKTVNIPKQAKAINALLEKARHEDLIIRAADGAEFLLGALDDFAEELARQRGNKKLMAFVKERFRRAREEQGIPLADVKQQLGLNSHGKKVSRRKAGPSSR